MFEKQIKKQEPLSLTRKVERYFMSLKKASLVLQTIPISKGGEVFF